MASGELPGDPEYEKQAVHDASTSKAAAEAILVAAHQAPAALVAPGPGGESSPNVEEPLFPDEKDEDQKVAGKRKREPITDIPRDLHAPDCGWIDDSGRPQAQRVRMFRAPSRRHTWQW